MSRTALRRVFVNFPYYTAPDNSMGLYCREVVSALEAAGCEVTFCTIGPSALAEASLAVPRRLRTGIGRLDCLTLYALMAVRLKGAAVVNISHEFIFPIALSRSVVIVHDTIQLDFPRHRWARLLLAPSWALARRCRLVIAPSHATASDLAAMGIKAEVVYNPFDVEVFRAVRERRRVPDIAALWCGTAAPHKNPRLFLDLCRRHPDKAFVLIAPATDAEALRAQAPPNAEVRSGVPFADYLDLLGRASMLVSTSLKEGYGRPPMEALLAGTPALVSDIPVYREIYGGVASFHDLTLHGLETALQALLLKRETSSAITPEAALTRIASPKDFEHFSKVLFTR